MKYILSFIFVIFVFSGCIRNEKVVEIKLPDTLPNQPVVIQKVNPIEEKTVVEELEPLVIEEQEGLSLESSDKLKIAFVYPSKYVSKYAKRAISTIMGYMSYMKVDYDLKVIDTHTEDITSLQNAFDDLKNNDYKNVIALFTPKSIVNLQQLKLDDTRVYLPLVEKDETFTDEKNFIYGAISYKEQIKKLVDFSSNVKNSMFYQDSFLGRKLKQYFDDLNVELLVQKEIKRKRNYFRGLIKDYKLNNSTLFLNTDIVKTSLILSQLTAYEIKPKIILSTQINYDPKLISLTQVKDRQNFVVVNSIDDVSVELLDEIKTFGADVKYEWVDYSVLVGINYLYDSNDSGLLKTQIIDNKVMYTPKLYRSTDFGFLEIKKDLDKIADI